MNWVGIIAALSAIGIIGWKLKSKTDGLQNITIDLNGKIHSIDFSKVVFAIQAVIKNPSNIKINILQPFVSIYYKDKEIATSNVSDQIITIPPFGTAPLKSILISASYLNLSSLTGELMQKIQDKNTKVTLDVKILVKVVLGMKDPLPERLKEYTGNKTIVAYPMKKEIVF
ncbi:MAG: LEA type 2 family protein [Bacteroidota bacterium]|nr:LEA type 2 family protein [Bacteroidota bacterium]